MKHFYGHIPSKDASCFRLVNATKLKSLADERKITEVDVEQAGKIGNKLFYIFFFLISLIWNFLLINQFSDELMLLEARPPITKDNLSEEALKGPNEETIARITAGIPIKNPSRLAPNTDCAADVNIITTFQRSNN